MTSNCIHGTGRLGADGYVRVGKGALAHRLAYCAAAGITIESIKGMSVMHSCDNPACVNPKHLSLGTHTDNMQDMLKKGRHKCRRRAAHPMAVLSEEQVSRMRAAYAEGGVTQYDLARQYGVSQPLVSKIMRGELWPTG